MKHKSGPNGGQWSPHAAQVGAHGGLMGPNERTSRPPGVVPHDMPPPGRRNETARRRQRDREDAISRRLGSLPESQRNKETRYEYLKDIGQDLARHWPKGLADLIKSIKGS